MKLPYREGTWFAVPLRTGGYAVGLVSRATINGKVIFCYFFGPRRTSVPTLSDVENFKAISAVKLARVGDLALIRREWPIVGHSTLWKRSDWPMPPFVRRSELSGKAWRVHHSNSDPTAIDREEPEPYESTLERDSVFGAGAMELVLTNLLS